MTALKKAEDLIPKLSDNEKSILLDYIFNLRENNPRGISKASGVCGGRACIEGARMPVWSLVLLCQIRNSFYIGQYPLVVAHVFFGLRLIFRFAC